MVRYRALHEKLPRGFKSIAHLEVLRTSDPTYGSLAPSDRPSRAELTYEPLRRYGALHERLPRGAKSAGHLEVLRTSDPTYGTLAPSDRPNGAELTYEPLRRFRLLARSSGGQLPRGFKSVAHLEILRTSDPTYGTLMPRRLQGRYNALPKVSSLKELVSLEGLLAPMQRNGSWQCLDAVAPEAPPAGAGPAAAAFGTAFGTAAVGGLVLSGLPDVDWPEEVSDDECEESLPQLGGWQQRSARGQRRERRSSRDQPRDSDQASLAVTHERASERCSNDTIASYLEDSCDGAASGDWSAAAAAFATKKGTPKKQQQANPAAAPSQGNPHFAPSAFWLPQQ